MSSFDKPEHEICPECNTYIHYRTFKRHLKEQHGYVYTDESPNYPVRPGLAKVTNKEQ